MYLYYNNLLPSSFDNVFSGMNQIHKFGTSSSYFYRVPFCRTNIILLIQLSFKGRSFFNTLVDEIRNAPSVFLFQSSLKYFI